MWMIGAKHRTLKNFKNYLGGVFVNKMVIKILLLKYFSKIIVINFREFVEFSNVDSSVFYEKISVLS